MRKIVFAGLLVLASAPAASATHIVDLPCEKLYKPEWQSRCQDFEPNDHWCWGYPLDLCLPIPRT